MYNFYFILYVGVRTFEDNESDEFNVEEFRRGMHYALEWTKRKGPKGPKGPRGPKGPKTQSSACKKQQDCTSRCDTIGAFNNRGSGAGVAGCYLGCMSMHKC